MNIMYYCPDCGRFFRVDTPDKSKRCKCIGCGAVSWPLGYGEEEWADASEAEQYNAIDAVKAKSRSCDSVAADEDIILNPTIADGSPSSGSDRSNMTPSEKEIHRIYIMVTIMFIAFVIGVILMTVAYARCYSLMNDLAELFDSYSYFDY